MKSAPANMGKPDLSTIALKLELSARESNILAISTETPSFLSSLRSYVEELDNLKDQ